MKITVAIIYHDVYEKYLPRAVESVKQQDCKYDVEILTINNTGRPLSHGCNKALKLARGDFFIRLDADDYLHPNALQIMADILAEGEWDAVYPDFWEVDETGRKVGYNSLYESPEHNPLGAGVMFWTRALREIGGYDESIDRQEAYEMMKRFREAGFKIYRLEIPLYYRTKHGSNMSSSVGKINRVRRIIEARDAKILCAITAKGSSTGCRNKNRRIFKDSMTLPEIAYYTATQCPYIDEVVIITDDEKFAHELNRKGYKAILEGDNPTKTALGAIASVVDELKEYDVIIQYQPTSPFVRPEHLTEAIEKLFVNKHDSVVSIKQMTDHPVRALQIVGNEVHPYGGFYDDRILNRQDLPDAFKFNGAFYVRRRYLYEEFARKQEGFALGNSVGFVLMGRRESVDINDEFDWELAKFIAEGMQPPKPAAEKLGKPTHKIEIE